MSEITFTGSNVLSNEMANQTGNISRNLFTRDNALVAKTDSARSTVVGTGDELAQTNPFAWNSDVSGQTTDGMLPAYLNQVRLSAYYQNNPLPVLEYSTKYGVQEPLGGPIRTKLT